MSTTLTPIRPLQEIQRDEVDEVKGAVVCCGVLIKGQQKLLTLKKTPHQTKAPKHNIKFVSTKINYQE